MLLFSMIYLTVNLYWIALTTDLQNVVHW